MVPDAVYQIHDFFDGKNLVKQHTNLLVHTFSSNRIPDDAKRPPVKYGEVSGTATI
jgi:hypothetical protein